MVGVIGFRSLQSTGFTKDQSPPSQCADVGQYADDDVARLRHDEWFSLGD
jgi:hypothetical protein